MFPLDETRPEFVCRAGIEKQFAGDAERQSDRVAFLSGQLSPPRLVLSDNGSRDTRGHGESRDAIPAPLAKSLCRGRPAPSASLTAAAISKCPTFTR